MKEIIGQYASDRFFNPDQPITDPDHLLAARGDGNVGMHHEETLFDHGDAPERVANELGFSEDVHVVAEDVVLRRPRARSTEKDPADEWMRQNGQTW